MHAILMDLKSVHMCRLGGCYHNRISEATYKLCIKEIFSVVVISLSLHHHTSHIIKEIDYKQGK